MRCIGISLGLLLALGFVACFGCASPSPAGPAETADFKSLVMLYSALAKTGRPPASEAEFRAAIKNQLAPTASVLKVANADDLFVSKRDGKPIVVIYGARPARFTADVVAYEQQGVGGKRLVGYSLGSIEEVDEQRFRELVPQGADAKAK